MKKTLLLLCCIVVLTGCNLTENAYKLEKIGEDNFLLNQKTGETYIVQDMNLLKLNIVSPSSYKNSKILTYHEPIAEDKLQIDLKIKLLDNFAFYKLTVMPFLEIIEEAGEKKENMKDFLWYEKLVSGNEPYKKISILLLDSDGFNVFRKNQNINESYTRLIGPDGKTNGFLYEGSFEISPIVSSIASNVNITWLF